MATNAFLCLICQPDVSRFYDWLTIVTTQKFEYFTQVTLHCKVEWENNDVTWPTWSSDGTMTDRWAVVVLTDLSAIGDEYRTYSAGRDVLPLIPTWPLRVRRFPLGIVIWSYSGQYTLKSYIQG